MAKFTDFRTDSNWVDGLEGNYEFRAKLYDVGSPFGIKGGRVSKLYIGKAEEFGIASYDRGWNHEPDSQYEEVFENIMNLLENSPKRFGG